MKRLLREPLLHFLLLGAALFAVYTFAGGGEGDAPRRDEIVVTAGTIEHMAALFTRTWQRPPTRGELEALVDDHVREEAAYREGLALGLDRDDTVVRRRVRQKLEFVATDLADQVEPTEDELAEHLEAHPDAFRIGARLSFRQVCLDPERRGEALDDDLRGLLATLNADPAADAAGLGDRRLLEHRFTDLSVRDVAACFGEAFAAALETLELGRWHGPVESGYGVHAVTVDAREGGRLPALDEVRDAVRRDWEAARRDALMDRFHAELIGSYGVEVRWPDGVPSDGDS